MQSILYRSICVLHLLYESCIIIAEKTCYHGKLTDEGCTGAPDRIDDLWIDFGEITL